MNLCVATHNEYIVKKWRKKNTEQTVFARILSTIYMNLQAVDRTRFYKWIFDAYPTILQTWTNKIIERKARRSRLIPISSSPGFICNVKANAFTDNTIHCGVIHIKNWKRFFFLCDKPVEYLFASKLCACICL